MSLTKKDVKRLDVWLNTQIFANRERFGRCVELRLVHIAAQGTEGAQIGSFVPDENAADGEVSEIRDNILQEAETDANGLGAYQKYAIVAMFEQDGDQTARARFVFGYNGGSEQTQTALTVSEPASGIGLVAQTQRHLESMTRMALLAAGQAQTAQAQLIERQASMIDNLMKDKFDAVELVSAALDKKDERAARIKELEQQSAMKQKAADQLFPMLQAIGLKMLGGGKMQLPEGQMKEAIRTFAKSLTQDQLGKLLEPLNEGQQLMMAELLQSVMAEDAPEQNTNTNGAIVPHEENKHGVQ